MTASRGRALASYRLLAARYGESCRRSWGVRIAAIDRLMLRDGHTVFDVACGTGETLVELAERVGPSGHVVGIEQCPEMAALARRRIEAVGLVDRIRLIVAPVEEASIIETADALLRSVWLCTRNDAIGNVAVMLAALRGIRHGHRVA